jgi:uncharacterized membrane protein
MAVDHGPIMAGIGNLALLFDVLGATMIIGGALITTYRAITIGRIAGGKAAYLVARRTFAKGLLLALDVLIAADLMRTVSVNLSVSSISALGMLVVVRTILSFSIQVEMEGNLPWRIGRHKSPRQPQI